ncbi:ABC transporter permease [Nocardia crassostreae]|uniref:ABC transporter permease n=1 Tax=Nocardia crassostreae TaxID=53428 RepID=UPI00082AE6C2|nr:ABC transporter permease [Nocardia crassostreae]
MILTAVPDSVLRAVNSEVRKVVSLRLNWTLAAIVLGGGLFAFTAMGLFLESTLEGGELIFSGGWSATAVAVALIGSVVLTAIFGAIAAGSEYRYRTIDTAALFTPDRNVLLGSKLGVVATISLGLMLFTELLGGAAMLLFGRDRLGIGAGFLAILGGALLAAVCWSVIGAALGLLLRSPAQAIAAVLGAAVLEPLVWVTARAVGTPGAATILPISATVGTISGGEFDDGVFIAPTPAAIVVLVLWTIAAVTAAWWFFTRRDL